MDVRSHIDRDDIGNTVITESAVKKEGVDAAKRDADAVKLAILRKQLKTVMTAEQFFRHEALTDAKFRIGTKGLISYQWPEGVQEKRRDQDRPCMTINRMPSFIRQVTNQARAAHLRIQVNPVDDHGDPKVAEVLQGMIRNVETKSFADRAYAMASDKQAEQGRGFFRLITEWVDDESFKQRLRIKREKNPLAIYIDPAAQEPDSSDADYAIKVTDVDAQKWKDITGRTEVPTAEIAESLGAPGDETGDWFPNGKVRIVEWFNREARGERKHLALMDDGTVIPYPTDAQKVALEAAGAKILTERWVQKKVMVWRKCDCCYIHEETVWATDQQPWTPVLGDELLLEGELDFRGVVRDAKEAARVYNVEVTALVENVSLGNKSPVVGARGQFGKEGEPMRKAWETAHLKPHAFLEYESMDIDGKPIPRPERVNFEPPIEGVVVAIQQADQDYKTTAGFQDASLGERGPQESGKAILARQRQDELGSSHYLDNLRYSLCSLGAQMIKAIRVVYDTPQVLRITGNDERQRKVMVFSGKDKDPRNDQYLKTHGGPEPLQLTINGQPQVIQPGEKIPFQLPKGVKEIYDLSVGEYDVEVSAGPQSGTRRQEAVEAMGQLLQTLPPEIAVKYLDLYFMMMDFPMARQMAERAKLMLPPELQDDEEGAEDIPPQLRAKIGAMQQQMQEAMQRLQAAEEKIRTDGVKIAGQAAMKKMELASRERIAGVQQETTLLVTDAEIEADRALVALKAQIEQTQMLLGLVHEQREAHKTRAHDVGLRLLDAAHATDTAQAGAAQDAASAERSHEQNLEAGDIGHQQALEAGDASHRQALESAEHAAALAPEPEGGDE